MSATPPSHEPRSPEPAVFNTEMSFADIDRIISSLGPSELVQFWGTFQSTAELPFPSATTLRPVDDIAAVMSGSKPATVLITEDYSDPLVARLIEEKRDLYNSLSSGYAVDYYGGVKYFLGKNKNVRILEEQYDGRGGDDSPKKADESFHRAVGEAFGYPTESIDAFITGFLASKERVKRGGRIARTVGRLANRRST